MSTVLALRPGTRGLWICQDGAVTVRRNHFLSPKQDCASFEVAQSPESSSCRVIKSRTVAGD